MALPDPSQYKGSPETLGLLVGSLCLCGLLGPYSEGKTRENGLGPRTSDSLSKEAGSGHFELAP